MFQSNPGMVTGKLLRKLKDTPTNKGFHACIQPIVYTAFLIVKTMFYG